jgi:Uncharacterized protein conserved in bacteria (DUF2252)
MTSNMARSGRITVHMVAVAAARQPTAVRANESQCLPDSASVPRRMSVPPPQSDPNQREVRRHPPDCKNLGHTGEDEDDTPNEGHHNLLIRAPPGSNPVRGTRAWILLFVGRGGTDPLVLQAKEARASVLEPYLGSSEYVGA